jgi:hypothetical protein
MERKTVLTAVVLLALLCAAVAQASVETTTAVVSNADTWIINATDTHGSDLYMNLYGSGTTSYMDYVRFDLSGLNIDTISSAKLVMTVAGNLPKPPYKNDNANTGRYALHGLNNIAGNTTQSWDEATLNRSNTGAEVNWTAGTVVMANVTNLDSDDGTGTTETVTNGSGSWARGTTITTTGSPLTSFLQSRVDDNGLVTFIIRQDAGGAKGYGLVTREEATDLAYRPVLEITYTSIPEPATMLILGLGGLLLARTKRR